MDEESRPLPNASDDEYEVDSPIVTRRRWLGKLKFVEPVMFLSMLAESIFSSVQLNVVELQYCKSVLGIDNSSECLNNTARYFPNVQSYTTTFSLYQKTYFSIFPIVLSVFIGPWSDTFGRCPIMLFSSIGSIMTSVLWVWGSTTKLHPNYFLMFGLPLSLSGNNTTNFLAMFCYVCDVTTMKKRAFRLGILQGFIHLGTLLGTFASERLIEISYTFTFAVAAFADVLRFFYILLFLKESVNVTETELASHSSNPFDWHYIKSLYEACYVRQTSRTLRLLIYVALLNFVSLVQISGEYGFFYLFLQKVRGWTLQDYVPLSCTYIIAATFYAFVGTWFLCKFLGLADMLVLNIVNGLRLVSGLILTFCRQWWLIYVANVLNSSYALYAGMVRVFVSKIVHADDLGKVFAVCGAIDMLTPIVGSLIFTTLYNATMNTYPNAIFLLSSFMCLLMALITAKIVSLHLSSPNGSVLSSNAASISN